MDVRLVAMEHIVPDLSLAVSIEEDGRLTLGRRHAQGKSALLRTADGLFVDGQSRSRLLNAVPDARDEPNKA